MENPISLPHLPPGFPASQKDEWGRSSFFPLQSTPVSSPRFTGIFFGPSKSGKTVALISMILEQYRGVFEKIYIFSPST